MNIVEKAKQLAKQAHQGQKYGDNDYYDYHLLGVVKILNLNAKTFLGENYHIYWVNNKLTKDCLIAGAILHDLEEDTDFSISKHPVANPQGFPDLVVDIVSGMTKRNGDTYFDYIKRLSTNSGPAVRAVKLADLTFNIQESEKKKLNGYEKQRLDKYKLARHILMP